MKSMIIYASRHHGNTEKLVKHLAERYEITLVDADKVKEISYAGYEQIGFASGIDFGKFYDPVTELAEKLPSGKAVYAIYTCARDHEQYGGQIKEIADRKGCCYLGKYGCRGYNTYGPWKLIGGMNKDHPNGPDLERLCSFYEEILAAVRKRTGDF